MQPTSARALIVTAILVIIGGFMIMSPSGAFFAFGLGALLAAFPAIFGTGRPRLIAVILLLGSIGLAARCYPDFRSEQERYRQKKPNALHTVGRGGKESA